MKQPLEEMVWSRDPRFANLIHCTRPLSSTADAGVGGPEQGEGGNIADRIRRKVSKLLYVPLDEVDEGTAISQYEIDSMIAAELRSGCLVIEFVGDHDNGESIGGRSW